VIAGEVIARRDSIIAMFTGLVTLRRLSREDNVIRLRIACHFLAVVAVIASLVTASSATASPSARLVYSRTAEAMTCPDEGALRKAVATRFGYDPFFPWAPKVVVVQMWRDRGRLRSRVQLVDEQGMARGTRELTSDEQASCASLFGATALAISIALDTIDAATASPDDASPTSEGGATASSSSSTPARVPSTTAAPSTVASTPVDATPTLSASDDGAALATTGSPPETGSARRDRKAQWTVGLGASVSGGIAPAPALGSAIFASIRWGRASLSIDGSAGESLPAHRGDPGQIVQSSLIVGDVAPCVHAGPLFGCALGTLGTLVAWSRDVASPQTQVRLFAGAGGRVGLEWAVSAAFAVWLRGDVSADLTPRTFVVGSGEPWSTWPVVVGTGAGLAMRLP
jgi:hypothetical protein